jgi:hypothetical protein
MKDTTYLHEILSTTAYQKPSSKIGSTATNFEISEGGSRYLEKRKSPVTSELIALSQCYFIIIRCLSTTCIKSASKIGLQASSLEIQYGGSRHILPQ